MATWLTLGQSRPIPRRQTAGGLSHDQSEKRAYGGHIGYRNRIRAESRHTR